jgi:hypothetical protein
LQGLSQRHRNSTRVKEYSDESFQVGWSTRQLHQRTRRFHQEGLSSLAKPIEP